MLIQFVDYGDSEEVSAESLISLPPDLLTLPPQVSHRANGSHSAMILSSLASHVTVMSFQLCSVSEYWQRGIEVSDMIVLCSIITKSLHNHYMSQLNKHPKSWVLTWLQKTATHVVDRTFHIRVAVIGKA